MTFVEWIKGWHLVSVAIVAGLVVFGILWLTDNTESTWNIQNDIAGDLRDQLGLAYNDTSLTVDCPDEVEWEANEEFHCIADDGDGNTARVTVHMESRAGDYIWQVE